MRVFASAAGGGYAQGDNNPVEVGEPEARRLLEAHQLQVRLGDLKKRAKAGEAGPNRASQVLNYVGPGRARFLSVLFRPKGKAKKYVFSVFYRTKDS